MDPKILARAAAVILLAGTLLACALELAQQGRTLEPATTIEKAPHSGRSLSLINLTAG